MANTTNFGWETPDDTDLVKDGAAAIRTLGNSIDTSLVDLKGGTTGQVLSKTTNTDMDFTWTTPNVGDITEIQAGTGISVASGTGPIPVITNTLATAFDAAGDLVYGTGADTFTKLAVGTAGQVLSVNSGATAPEWKTISSGGYTLLSTVNASAATSVSFTSISGSYKHLFLTWADAGSDSSATYWSIRINNDSNTNRHQFRGWRVTSDPTAIAGINDRSTLLGNSTTSAPIGPVEGSGSTTSYNGYGGMWFYNYADTSDQKHGFWQAMTGNANNGQFEANMVNWLYNQTTAITQIDFVRSSTQTITGTFRLYGVS